MGQDRTIPAYNLRYGNGTTLDLDCLMKSLDGEIRTFIHLEGEGWVDQVSRDVMKWNKMRTKEEHRTTAPLFFLFSSSKLKAPNND